MRKEPKKTSYYRAMLVERIWRHGPVSRTQLARETRVRMPVITSLMRDLIKREVLVEEGRSVSGLGRKHILLNLNRRHGFVIGIEFEPDNIAALVVDMCGRIVKRRKMAMPAQKNNAAIIQALMAAAEDAINESGYVRSALQGIGVADPGIVDIKQGLTLFCSLLPEWRNAPLRRLLRERFLTPVLLDENTFSKTVCEQRYGAGQGLENFLCVEVGNGIACGIILGGRLYRGHAGVAGELGHVRVLENGPICNCGSAGCLETVASYPAIIRQVREALRNGTRSLIPSLAGASIENIGMPHVFEAARRGDKLALGLLDQATRYLGLAIANAVNLLNPQVVLLSVDMLEGEDLIIAPIRQIVSRHTIAVAGQALEVRAARIGADAGAWGAAILMLDRLYAGIDKSMQH
jgi:N-acetylglucosamine repressor